jgi:hypothetical protein
MHTWYCPECGSEYELSDCTEGRVLGLNARLHCPNCHERVRLSGPALLTATLVVCLFGGLFLDWPPLLAVLVLGAAISALRIVQQVRARRSHADEQNSSAS